MKNLKTSDWVHKEVKIFTAKEGTPITTFTDAALCFLLRIRGHKFKAPPQKKQSTNKTK